MGFKNVLLGVVLMVVGIGICLFAASMFIFGPISGGGGNDLMSLVIFIFGTAIGIYGKNMTRG